MPKPFEATIPGPRSFRTRIRLALLDDLFLDETGILQQIRNQEGGRTILRTYEIGALKVQAAQVRKELQEKAGIEGSRRSPSGREEINAEWKALPRRERRAIIAGVKPHLSPYTGPAEAWATIWETIDADTQSKAFDPELREEIVQAEAAIEEVV